MKLNLVDNKPALYATLIAVLAIGAWGLRHAPIDRPALAAGQPGEHHKTAVKVASTSTPSAAGASAHISAPAAPVPKLKPLRADVDRGVCLAHVWSLGGSLGYGTPTSEKTLKHLKKLGVNWLSLTPFGWMSGLNADHVYGENNRMVPPGAERSKAIGRMTAQARKMGMKILLAPHIWIRGGGWRGQIAPQDAAGKPDWPAWWASYDDFMMYYARVAARDKISAFLVGVELKSTTANAPDGMLKLIARIRKVYHGQLIYAANWDEKVPDRIWKALDAVGVQFYPPLTKDPHPPIGELVQAIKKRVEGWDAIAKRVNRPLIITEVGYKSTPSAVRKPFGWPEDMPVSARIPDQKLQARAFKALFDVLDADKRCRGVFVWKYFTYPKTWEATPYGFSIRGKLAEKVLEAAYARPSRH